jgi:hypothetical protein
MLSRNARIGAVMPNSISGSGALGATGPSAGGDVFIHGQAENTTCGEAKPVPRIIPIITKTQIRCILSFSFLLFALPLKKPRALWITFPKGCMPL